MDQAEKSWRVFLASDANPVPPKYPMLRKQMKLAFMHGFGAGKTAAMVEDIARKIIADGKGPERPRPIINKNEADALRRIRDQGPIAWAKGRGRAGGAIARMFGRMQEKGLCTAPPYVPTKLGREELDKYDAWHFPGIKRERA